MRKYKRFVARARMEALQVTQISRKLSRAWRRLIGTGDLAKEGRKAQIKPKKPSRRVRAVLGR